MKPRGASILADLEKAAPIAHASPGAALPVETVGPEVETVVEPAGAAGGQLQVSAPQTAVANPASAPTTVPPSADWRVLPKKVQTVQFNVRILADVYEELKELATFSPDDSMTSIAARGIAREIALMKFERENPPKE